MNIKNVTATQPPYSPIKHQLIVLGNGFDLECGLKSKFKDFFASEREPRLNIDNNRIPDISKNGGLNTAWGAYIQKNLTVWDLILEYSENNYWYDVENAIWQWIKPAEPKNNKNYKNPDTIDKNVNNEPLTAVIKLFKTTRTASETGINDLPQPLRIFSPESVNDYLLEPYDKSTRNMLWAVAKYIYQTKPVSEILNPNTKLRPYLLNFLYTELHRFESAFYVYLKHELKRNRDYQKQATQVFNALSKDEFPYRNSRNTSVLDFNYTRPNRLLGLGKYCINIHGSIRTKNIVIGVDGTDYMSDSEIVPFTKTYRLLALKHPLPGVLFPESNSQLESLDLIKFYGHSLNQADYSYFQSIFDSVNLYHSRTRLIFYYKQYLQDDGSLCPLEVVQQEMFQNVTKLLNHYGETLDNKDHGKNLMHKLLLEGRLTVREFKYSNM